jgi:competence protein ComEA
VINWLQKYQLLVAAGAFLLLAAVFAASLVLNDQPPPLELRPGSGLPPGTPIKVHVVGSVLAPGVYDLREGDRVADAIEAAGGPSEDAAIDGLNLARRLRDGEQLQVPSSQRTIVVRSLAPGEKLDINNASAALLETLPGIGPTYARRIVDSRAVDGPYQTVDELLQRRVIPASTLEGIRGLITVGP